MIRDGRVKPLERLFIALVAAEPLTDSLRAYIEELVREVGGRRDFKLVQGYGMKVAFYECTENYVIHLNPKYFYWEVVDPETYEPVGEGEPGVLVFSHVELYGTAFLRGFTGDLIRSGVR